jgi:hypothetical protein
MTRLERDLDHFVGQYREEYTTADQWAGVGAILTIWAETDFLTGLGLATMVAEGPLPTVVGPFGLRIPTAALPRLALDLADRYRQMADGQRKGVRAVFDTLQDQIDWQDVFAAGRRRGRRSSEQAVRQAG